MMITHYAPCHPSNMLKSFGRVYNHRFKGVDRLKKQNSCNSLKNCLYYLEA